MEIVGLFTGGGIVAAFTIPQIIKKTKAEARSAELENVQKAVEEWQKIANERQEQISDEQKHCDYYIRENERLNKKIDELYTANSGWRDKVNDLQTEIARLQVKLATDEPRLCMRRTCANREPESGY